MSTTSNFAYQAKLYNETFALKSSLWKLQKWLNQFRGKSASPSPCSTISRSSNNINRNKRKQENENNFRSIIEELQTMLGSHKRKHKIKRVRKKPTQYYTLNRELKNIGENLNLSFDDEVNDSKQITKIFYGSKHQLSQFTLEIGFNNITCDIIPSECVLDITLCEKDPDNDNNYIDLIFNKIDTKTIINDLQLIINDGDYDKLTQKILFIKHFDDFHNYFPILLLNNLIENSNKNNIYCIHKQIELCLKILPNIIEYKRLLDGPCIIYEKQIMDCILTKIKPPKVYKLSFVGLYPSKCIGINNNNNNNNKLTSIKPIIKNNNNENKNDNNNKEYLLYWFILNPSIIVPMEIAKKLFKNCLGNLWDKYNIDQDRKFDDENEDRRSAHSSKNIDETYCYYNMLIGDNDLKYKKGIEIFNNEYQYYECKNSNYCGNGVKIDQLYIYDLNYINEKNISKSTLYNIINELKNWVLMNQLYTQCFEHNYRKWKIIYDKMNIKNMERINNKFEINIKNSNHLQVKHMKYDENHDENSNDENKENEMDIDDNNNDNDNNNGYEQYRNDYKLPPNVNEWLADFYIDIEHNISVKVRYWVLNVNIKDKGLNIEVDDVCEEENALELDVMYQNKISDILEKTNSVPITLSYVSQLFDGRYLKEKLKREQIKKQHVVEMNDNDNDDNMIDID